ncbi:hypothetical protein GUI37_06070 [Helcococcus kunzii]|uniref:hypothetical protein n=1 Tax=Helcococcus kunzii TaxID=40091 RepID=UPI001BAFA167|nr:hypothetical protein [Helcococcus kunzii]QUY65106.1 hypothetical protein GUI37_06070 [Helcococcus kunzii]
MDLVRASILEIHKEETTTLNGKTYVDVELTVNMWGSIRREERVFRLSDWEDYKEQGYFLT